MLKAHSSEAANRPRRTKFGVGEVVAERLVKGAKLMSRAPSTLTLAELSRELDAPPEAIRRVGLKRKAARRRTGRLGKCSSRMAPWGHAGQLGGGRLVPRSCRHLGKLRCRLRVQGGDHKLAFAAQDVGRGVVVSVVRLHGGELHRLHLLQFGHHTFGNALVSSSIRTSASARQPVSIPHPLCRPAPRLHLSSRCSRVHLFKFESLED